MEVVGAEDEEDETLRPPTSVETESILPSRMTLPQPKPEPGVSVTLLPLSLEELLESFSLSDEEGGEAGRPVDERRPTSAKETIEPLREPFLVGAFGFMLLLRVGLVSVPDAELGPPPSLSMPAAFAA